VVYHREHKEKKAAMNRRRYLVSERKRAEEEPAPVEATAPVRPILRHVQMVCSLIEGRSVSLGEVLVMLRQKGRQHRMCRQRRVDYIVAQLKDRGS
jgi:hypothetical protein